MKAIFMKSIPYKTFTLLLMMSILLIACTPQANSESDTSDQTDNTSSNTDNQEAETDSIDESDPVSVARAFWAAIYAGEGEEAISYVCEFDTVGIDNDSVGAMFGAVNLGPVEFDTSNVNYTLLNQDGGVAEVEISGELLIGVTGTEDQTPVEFDPLTLTLVNNDGWEVCSET